MNGCVAVFDIGKTNIKLVVFDRGGAILAERSAPNAPLAPDATWPYLRLDTGRAWAFLIGALKDLGAHFSIEAISIAAHGAAGVLVTDEGDALPAVDYEFDGYGALAAEYDKVRPRFEETLSPNLPRGLNLGKQVFYLERQFPAQFKAARAFLGYPQYWSWRLSGVAATEFTSVGSHTDLWRPKEGRLSSMVDKLGWRRLFPPMRKAWDTLGTLKPKVAAATGLPPIVRVVCGAHDFKRVPGASSHVKARSVHGHLDRHLGHHHGRRGKKPSRPGSRHAGQRRCARRSRADRALHGRA